MTDTAKPGDVGAPLLKREMLGVESRETMNRWGIPGWLEEEVRARDKSCVYCGIPLIDRDAPGGSRKSVATWEHIINDASIVTRENIALCCAGCNSSKGTKQLSEWMQSGYCAERGINSDTVADVVKEALRIHAQPAPPDRQPPR